VGSVADITIFAERPWTVDARLFHSKGKSTPFNGAAFHRRAITTLVDGFVVYEHGRVMPRDEGVPA
jgi:dihydroorotase